MLASGSWRPFVVRTADVDGDGDRDVVHAADWDGLIAVGRNSGGSGTFLAPQTAAVNYAVADLRTADVDGDADLDLAYGGQGHVSWIRHLDGQGSFGAPSLVASGASTLASIVATDCDVDGDLDLAVSHLTSELAWIENLDGAGTFGASVTIDANVGGTSLRSDDLDGDEDLLLADGLDGDGNGVHDACDVATGASPDVDGDWVPDECELQDCNQNGVPDLQDITGGFSADANGNWLPDECEPFATLQSLSGSNLSVGTGGSQSLLLLASAPFGDRLFLVLGSQSGIAPGLTLGGDALPLNRDGYFDLLLASPNPPWLSPSLGFTSPAGTAFVPFVVPPGAPPSLVGTAVHHAYVVLDWTSSGAGDASLLLVSNPVGAQFVP